VIAALLALMGRAKNRRSVQIAEAFARQNAKKTAALPLGLPASLTRPKSLRENGAGEGIRTLDPNLGKVVLYP
jgi:hypothetical protein